MLNQKLLGIAGIRRHSCARLAGVGQPQGDSPARRRRGLRAPGCDRLGWCCGPAGAGPRSNGCRPGSSSLLGYATKGTEFLFGPSEANPLAHTFAIAALPVIIFFASLVAILYYLGIMQRIVRWVGGAIGWVTGISRVESLSAAANIFVGQSEVAAGRPALSRRAAAFAPVHGDGGRHGRRRRDHPCRLRQPARRALPPYLLAAAFMSAPGGILMAKMIMPDDPRDTDAVEDHKVEVAETFEEGEQPANIIMAAAAGAQTGVKLAVAVGAMVLAFVALVALANGLLGGVGNLVGIPDLSFQRLVGYVFAPFMFLIGIPWNEALTAGGLFGTKLVLNEFVAFIDLGKMGAATLSDRSRAIVTFALVRLCQFQLDRDPDGGDRRACPEPASGDRQAGAARSARRLARQFDERGAGGPDDSGYKTAPWLRLPTNISRPSR